MNLKITREGIDIISKDKDVVLYRTVDDNIVLAADSKSYSEVFNGCSHDVVERTIYNELFNLMQKLSNEYDIENYFCRDGIAYKLCFYGNDKENVLKLQKNGEEILFELKKLYDNSSFKSGRVVIDEFSNYKEEFLDFFKALLKDAADIKNIPVQKVYKM